MILVIDNYDSFSYNLVQLFGKIIQEKNWKEAIKVVRNDELTVEEIDDLSPTAIVLSPGPGRPKDAGICVDVVRKLGGKYKMLGICLGHQAICEAYGATISYAKVLMHGKQSEIQVEENEVIFGNIQKRTTVARYHSLAAKKETMPECLSVIAKTEDGEVMAVKHKQYKMYGLQFHPESVLTKEGQKMVENFLKGDAEDDKTSNL